MNAMKFVIIVFFLGQFYSVLSQRNFDTSDQGNQPPSVRLTPKEDKKISLNLQNQIIASLKHELKYKLDSLKLAQRIRYVNRYIKVYKTVPVYIPLINKDAFLLADTLNDVYLDSILPRKRLLKRIFKRK